MKSIVNRLITVVVVVAVGVIVLITGAALLISHNIAVSRAAPPGPSGYARSAAARKADDAAASWQDQEFASLSRLAPWLGPAGRSLIDACSESGGPGGIFGGGTAVTYSCQRTDTRYYSYGGTRIAEFNAVLTRLGWHGFAYLPDGTAWPEISAQPGTLPGSIGKLSLEYSWAAHGTALDPDQELGAIPRALPAGEHYYLQVVRPGASSILARLTAADNQVLIVSLTEYYAQSAP
jgi:hypothetical protein